MHPVRVGSRPLVASHSHLLKLIQRLSGGVALEEDISLEPPRKRNGQLIFGKLSRRHAKYPVKLFQRALHGFRDPEEDHDEGNDVEACV